MRSRVALLLVLILSGFVLGAAWDRCADDEGECGSLCHAGCLDNCATAPMPRVATSFAAQRRATPGSPPLAPAPLARADSPDTQPPRA